jgi:hypothetical protein
VGQLLFVVSRDAVKRYQDLKRAFSDQESVEVILDRRVGERRGSGAQPVEPSRDRRRSARRSRPEVDSDLGSLGYSVVRLAALARHLSNANLPR